MRTRTIFGAMIGALLITSLLWLGVYAYDNIIITDGVTEPDVISDSTSAFTLKPGERALAGNLGLELVRIENDSRCPKDAVCVWAGEIQAQVVLSAGTRRETAVLRSLGEGYAFGGHQIAITDVAPARLGPPATQDDYRITFSVQDL